MSESRFLCKGIFQPKTKKIIKLRHIEENYRDLVNSTTNKIISYKEESSESFENQIANNFERLEICCYF